MTLRHAGCSKALLTLLPLLTPPVFVNRAEGRGPSGASSSSVRSIRPSHASHFIKAMWIGSFPQLHNETSRKLGIGSCLACPVCYTQSAPICCALTGVSVSACVYALCKQAHACAQTTVNTLKLSYVWSITPDDAFVK